MTPSNANTSELAEIISDDEILRVHGHANFGPQMTPREVVNEGVLKYAFGYHSGHTQLCILMEHGLITKPRPDSYDASLTKKGKRYARALGGYQNAVTAASARARIAELERALEKTASDFREAAEAHDAEKTRADRLAKALDDLQDLFAREGECSMERFERIAEMFRKDTGYLAPGKDPGMLSQQPEGDELRRIYDDWYAAKITEARAALQQEG